MLSLKRLAPPTLAALLLAAFPALPALAGAAEKAPASEPAKAAKTSPTDVMARINGVAITRQELDRAVKVMLAQNQIPQPVQPEIMQQAENAALEQLVAAELLFQQAQKIEIKDLDKEASERVAENRAKFKSDEEFQKTLKEVDMTLADMQAFARKDIQINNLIESRFASKAEVSDAEAKAFYDNNLDAYFKKPETARASHILIGSDEKASAEEHKKAREKAEAILKRLQAGEDFAAIAKAESTCPSAAQGGDLGTFKRGEMVPAFDKAAFALKPGEISGVVETQYGYHIIKLVEKHDASTDKFADVKDKIVAFLKRQKVQKEVTNYIKELKKGAKIEKS